jgi:predicted MFS family arabinose efflux permease
MKFSVIFKEHSGARAFFLSIIVWGIGSGCFASVLNNFLSDVYQMDSLHRGWLEFFREFPGLILVLLFALLSKVSDWKILRLGTLVSMCGAALILVPADKIYVTGAIMIWSLGEHLIMPARQMIAMQVARPEHAGQSLGFMTSVMNFGTVAGSLLVAGIFYFGSRFGKLAPMTMFWIVWGVVIMLLLISAISTFASNAPDGITKRPKVYFHRKFSKFYALELFYGARKQIFMTFAPYVLIQVYGFSTEWMALLLGVCALVNIGAAPMVGRLTDRIGYRNVMIWDTVILFFVCIMYGFAKSIFPPHLVLTAVCVNFLLDAIISTTALATNIYVREVASDSNELASTMSTGISINHLISILAAPLGGWVWMRFGIGVLFLFSAIMALCNSLFAWTLPKPRSVEPKGKG